MKEYAVHIQRVLNALLKRSSFDNVKWEEFESVRVSVSKLIELEKKLQGWQSPPPLPVTPDVFKEAEKIIKEVTKDIDPPKRKRGRPKKAKIS